MTFGCAEKDTCGMASDEKRARAVVKIFMVTLWVMLLLVIRASEAGQHGLLPLTKL